MQTPFFHASLRQQKSMEEEFYANFYSPPESVRVTGCDQTTNLTSTNQQLSKYHVAIMRW